MKVCTIGYVDYDGSEKLIPDYSFIQNDTEPFRMITLRNGIKNNYNLIYMESLKYLLSPLKIGLEKQGLEISGMVGT